MNSAKQVKSASVVTTTFLVKSVTTETRNTRPRQITIKKKMQTCVNEPLYKSQIVC